MAVVAGAIGEKGGEYLEERVNGAAHLITNGDDDFRTRTLEHLGALHNFALFLTRNVPEADDLVQETYFRALRFKHKYHEEGTLRAWLFQIMRNKFLTSCRLRERKVLTFEENGIPYGKIMFQDAPNVGAREIEMSIDLERALMKLPEGFREVILLTEILGETIGKTSSATKFPVGTVKSRHSRAYDKLNALLRDYGNGPRERQVNEYSQEQKDEIIAAHPAAEGYAMRVTRILPYSPSSYVVLKIWKAANLAIKPPLKPAKYTEKNGNHNGTSSPNGIHTKVKKEKFAYKISPWYHTVNKYHNELVPRIPITPISLDSDSSYVTQITLQKLEGPNEVAQIVEQHNRLGSNGKLPEKPYRYKNFRNRKVLQPQ